MELLPEIYDLFMQHMHYDEYYIILTLCKKFYRMYNRYMTYYADDITFPTYHNSTRLLSWKYDNGYTENLNELIIYTMCNGDYDMFKLILYQHGYYNSMTNRLFNSNIDIIKFIYASHYICSDKFRTLYNNTNITMSALKYMIYNYNVRTSYISHCVFEWKYIYACDVMHSVGSAISMRLTNITFDYVKYIYSVCNLVILGIMYDSIACGNLRIIKYLYSIGYSFRKSNVNIAASKNFYHIIVFMDTTGYDCSDVIVYDDIYDTYVKWPDWKKINYTN